MTAVIDPPSGPDVYFGGKSPAPLPWAPLPYMDEYLFELSTGETPRTPEYLRSVKAGLAHFAAFAADEGIRHPDEIKREHILRFQAHIQTGVLSHRGTPLSLSYRQQIMKYLRGWVNWLEEVRYIDANPWYRVRVGRVAKQPKPLEEGEVADLFEAHRSQAFSIPPFAYHRREAILVILFGWGLRIHELQSLNLSQMPMTVDWVTVRNKGGGTKQEPYGDEMKGVVNRWLRVRAQSALRTEDALIIDQSGGRLSIARIRQIITDLGIRAGIQINPHRLRDTFGTTMLDNDVPVERVMKMLGHTRREQTLAYSKIREPKLKESHDKVMDPILRDLIHGPRATPTPPTPKPPEWWQNTEDL